MSCLPGRERGRRVTFRRSTTCGYADSAFQAVVASLNDIALAGERVIQKVKFSYSVISLFRFGRQSVI
jgi:hypothetical protein